MLKMLLPYSLEERGVKVAEMLDLPYPVSRKAMEKVYKERDISWQKVKTYRRINWKNGELLQCRKAFLSTVSNLERNGFQLYWYDQSSCNIWTTLQRGW